MNIDRNQSRSRTIPLLWLILLAFGVKLFGAVGLVTYLFYRSEQAAAHKLAIRINTEISTRVTEKTTTYLQAIDRVSKNNINEETSRFLRTIDIKTGTVFIMERDQTLVATSSLLQKPFPLLQNGQDQKSLKAIDSQNLQISGAAKYLRDRNVNLANVRQSEQFEFEINGELQLGQVTLLRDRNGLDWLIVLVNPESEFTADIQDDQTWIMLCVITLIVVTAISLITTRWVIEPILRLSRASIALASGEWQEPLAENNAITEINSLSQSFNQMSGQLRQSLEQKSAEIQLSTNKLNDILNSATASITRLLVKADGNLEVDYISDGCESVSGYTANELIEDQSLWLSRANPEDWQAVEAQVYENIFAERCGTYIYRLKHKDGSWRWISQINSSRWDALLNAWVVTIISSDISDRKRTELALIEAKAAAEAATKAKSEFLASMSHEIRTPMNGVIGMTQILGMTELTTEQREFLKTIKDSGEALLTIINDILDFSKIESGMLEIESRDFELEEVINGVCKLLESQVSVKQIDLKYAIASNIPKIVIGDLARLRQILLNLVGNAVKFTQKGQVSISVSGKRMKGKYALTFAIADTGIGIASDRLDFLFQVFTQADNSISREYGGTGLGLAISKRLVNLMEGTIWVESLGQVGGCPPINWKPQPRNPLTPQGSTFYFTITLLINQTLNQPRTDLVKEFAIDEKFAEKFPLQILLVEDNPVNQMVAKLMLERLGYQINAIANNGLEAVQAVQNYDYDLILMDVQMPKMDGLTATKMIRKDLKSLVRIVAMTADAMPEDRQACLDAGMDDFISKPISIQALMSIASSTK